MTVKDYVIKFESLHSKFKSLKMELPEGVKAYRLLHSANLTGEENKLCLATIKELKFYDMKTQIMKISGDEVSTLSNDVSVCQIKEEPVFLNESQGKMHASESEKYTEFSEIVQEETIYDSGNQGNNNHYPNRGCNGNPR